VPSKIRAGSLTEGRQQFERQCAWYGRVDVEQVHNLVPWREHLPWLEAERARGLIGLLGVTHYQPTAFQEMAEALRTGRFDAVQLPYNPTERDCEQLLLPLAAELGVPVVVMRPLGVGALARRPTAAVRAGAPGRVRRRDVAAGTAQMGAIGRADRRCHLRDLEPEHARVNAAAGTPPWFGAEERELVARLATRT